ncbi:MAG: ribonuclease E/G, partial [Lachnospiraceae bacterium]|nr:ribonuclease E/G [Lachnospiraceae bacterium]
AKYAVAHMGSGNLLFSKKLSAKEKDIILNYLVSKAIVTRDKKLIGMEDVDITIRTDAGKLVAEEKLDVLLQDVEQTTASLRRLISQASMRTCYTVHQRPVTWLSEVWHELHLCGFAIEEYVTDDFTMLQTLKELVHASEADKIRLHQDEKISLETLYGLTFKIDELLQTKVWLPSGGYLYIEPTEAMTVVDVNTGKAIRKGDDSEALFYEVNREAAAELARQLRLRNISGMVIVDFINMKSKENEHAILSYMKECAKADYSKIAVYDFTRLGLLELTRNKKSKALHEILR